MSALRGETLPGILSVDADMMYVGSKSGSGSAVAAIAPGTHQDAKARVVPDGDKFLEFLEETIQEVKVLESTVVSYSSVPTYRLSDEEVNRAALKAVNVKGTELDYEICKSKRIRVVERLKRKFLDALTLLKGTKKEVTQMIIDERANGAEYEAALDLEEKNQIKAEAIELKRTVGRLSIVKRREEKFRGYEEDVDKLKKVKSNLESDSKQFEELYFKKKAGSGDDSGNLSRSHS